MFTFITQVRQSDPQPIQTSTGWIMPKKKYLTKVWHSQTKITEIHLAKYFDVTEVANPQNMCELLELVQKYAKDPDSCMLQHTISEDTPTKNIRRNKETFSVVPKNKFMVFDVDSFPRPDHIDPLDISGQVHFILDLLSERFPVWFDKEMRFIAKGSSSAGIKTKEIRLHLYLENTVPVNTKQLDTIVDEVNTKFNEEFGVDLFDDSLYTRAHILYTADPIFEGTISNPFDDSTWSRIVFNLKGYTASIPPSTKEKERVKTVSLTDEDIENIEHYHGAEVVTPRVAQILEDIRENPDNVYTKKAPRLFFVAMEEGIGFSTIESAFKVAMQDHPKIISGERVIEEYLNAAKTFCFQTIKSRAIRTIPEYVNIETTPREEIDPEHRSEVLTKWPISILYPEGAGTDDGYLHIPELPPKNKLTFWKASLGTGKTTAVQRLVNGDDIMGIKPKLYGRMLAITNTVSLVDGNAKKLGAPANKAYLDKEYRDSFLSNPNGRMSTTIHSLHKFTQMAQDGAIDFVFIDECDAVMDTLINGPATILRERRKCIEALKLLLQTAKYVVLADGDISEETMFAYFAMCSKPIALVDYKVQKLKGSVAYEVKSEETLWINGVHCALDEGQKVLVVTDLGPKEINERVRALTLLHPGLVIKGVHSESTKDQDIKDILENTNAALDQYSVDCLICSPSVVSGVDFYYFDVVGLITKTKIASPNLRFQALRRCRKPNKEYWVYTDPDTSNFSTGYYKSEYREDYMPQDYIQEKYALRKNREYSGFLSNLRFMLMDQGCEVVVDAEVIRGETLEKIVEDTCGVSAKALEREALINAILTSTEDSSPKRYNSAYETKKLITHYYDLESPENVLYEDVDMYIDQDLHKRMSALADVVRGGLWTPMLYSVKHLESFAKFLRSYSIQWYNSTGENAFTGFGKSMNLRNSSYQASRIGLKLFPMDKKIDPNWQQVKDWFRKYCEYEELPIPREFLTPEEIAKAEESSEDLSLREELVETFSVDMGAKDWFSVTGFN